MRILYWTNLFWPEIGGVQVLASRLLPELRSRGHDVLVLTGRGDDRLADLDDFGGIPIHRFPFHQALEHRDFNAVMDIRSRISAVKASFRPDLVHVNFCDPGVFFHLATRRAHAAPTVISVRLSVTQEEAGTQSLLGQALRTAEWIAANSGFVLEGLRRLVPEITERSSVIYNGLDLPDLTPAPLPFSPPVLLGIGRLVPEKGYDLAVSAMAGVLGRFPEARLVLAGNGSAQAGLERQAHELGIGHRVEFRGWVQPEEVPSLLNAATVVLMPSRWQEAFGLVALQAAQMGRPVVATRVGGLPEVVEDGVTGIVVDPESAGALAEASIDLLSHPERAAAMGERARHRATRHFSWISHVDAYDALYRRWESRTRGSRRAAENSSHPADPHRRRRGGSLG